MAINILQEKMSNFTKATKDALEAKNWYAALVIALTLPDICGYLENPGLKSSPRYVKWFNRYMTPKYTRRIGREQEEHIFLNGKDAYALRCSYLHAGTFHTDEQWIKDALNRFRFVTTEEGSTVHLNQMDATLQLQIDLYCLEICEAVDVWVNEFKDNKEVLTITNTMIEIEHFGDSFEL